EKDTSHLERLLVTQGLAVSAYAPPPIKGDRLRKQDDDDWRSLCDEAAPRARSAFFVAGPEGLSAVQKRQIQLFFDHKDKVQQAGGFFPLVVVSDDGTGMPGAVDKLILRWGELRHLRLASDNEQNCERIVQEINRYTAPRFGKRFRVALSYSSSHLRPV